MSKGPAEMSQSPQHGTVQSSVKSGSQETWLLRDEKCLNNNGGLILPCLRMLARKGKQSRKPKQENGLSAGPRGVRVCGEGFLLVFKICHTTWASKTDDTLWNFLVWEKGQSSFRGRSCQLVANVCGKGAFISGIVTPGCGIHLTLQPYQSIALLLLRKSLYWDLKMPKFSNHCQRLLELRWAFIIRMYFLF